MKCKSRLMRATLCVVTATRVAEYVPAGAILEIPVALSDTKQLVPVIWKDRHVLMFACDLRGRCQEFKAKAAAA